MRNWFFYRRCGWHCAFLVWKQKHVFVAKHISKRMTWLYAVWSWFCLSPGSSSWGVQEKRFVLIMHTQVIFPQAPRVVSALCSQRVGIGVEGCGARSGTISYDLVTWSFVEYNWEVGFLFIYFSKWSSGHWRGFRRNFQNDFTYRLSFAPYSKTDRSTLTISETNTQGSWMTEWDHTWRMTLSLISSRDVDWQ